MLLRQAEIVGTDIEDRVSAMVEAAAILSARGRVAESIDLWEQVLGRAPERRDAVDALETLYRRDGRWYDLVELYERRLGFATTMDEAVALRAQIGEIREREMRDLAGAIENYDAALSGNPRHADVLAALERLLRDPDARPLAAQVLEPIYVAEQRWHELATVYEARLEASTDPRERLRMTLDVARLYEEQLEDFEAASHWYARLFREDPSDDGVRDQLQRLASVADNWEFVADTYQDYLEDEPNDTAAVRDVAIAAASIFDRRLGQVDSALLAYRRALGVPTEPDHLPTEAELIRRVEDLLTRTSRFADLAMIYDEAIARAQGGPSERTLLAKRARLLEDSLRDPKGAISTWRELAAATEDDADAGGRRRLPRVDVRAGAPLSKRRAVARAGRAVRDARRPRRGAGGARRAAAAPGRRAGEAPGRSGSRRRSIRRGAHRAGRQVARGGGAGAAGRRRAAARADLRAARAGVPAGRRLAEAGRHPRRQARLRRRSAAQGGDAAGDRADPRAARRRSAAGAGGGGARLAPRRRRLRGGRAADRAGAPSRRLGLRGGRAVERRRVRR